MPLAVKAKERETVPANLCVVDTNVVVSGLIGHDPNSPPARILDSMLGGEITYLMSSELLDEYLTVLLRPRLVKLHGLTGEELDRLLADLVANGAWREPAREPVSSSTAPDAGDNHLWALLASYPQALLITGDRLLLEQPPGDASVIPPRQFVETFLSRA